jgi:hypothetical protein
MNEEDEIKILMAREIVEDICEEVDVEWKPKCRTILYRILVHGATPENIKPLIELPEKCKGTIKKKLKEIVYGSTEISEEEKEFRKNAKKYLVQAHKTDIFSTFYLLKRIFPLLDCLCLGLRSRRSLGTIPLCHKSPMTLDTASTHSHIVYISFSQLASQRKHLSGH